MLDYLWSLLLNYSILTSSTVHISLIALESLLLGYLFTLYEGEKLKVKITTRKSDKEAWVMAAKNSGFMILGAATAVWLITGNIHGDYAIQGIPRSEFPSEAPTLFQWLWQTLFMILCVDFGVYWGHRLLHQGFLYTKIHSVHHAYYDVMAIHAVCAHMIELYLVMILLFLIPRLIYITVGIHPLVAYITTFLLTGHNLISHSGYNDHLDDLTFRIISGSKMHLVHHQRPKYNFGFYTRIWDYTFGTLMNYDEMLSG